MSEKDNKAKEEKGAKVAKASSKPASKKTAAPVEKKAKAKKMTAPGTAVKKAIAKPKRLFIPSENKSIGNSLNLSGIPNLSNQSIEFCLELFFEPLIFDKNCKKSSADTPL